MNFHITHTPYKTFEGYKRWNLHLFWISSMHYKFDFYMNYIQRGIHYMCPKTSLHKDHTIKMCSFIFANTFIIKMTNQFIVTYVHYTKKIQILTQTTWNRERENMNLKFHPQPFIYLKRKIDELSIPFIYIYKIFSFINYKPTILCHIVSL